MGDNSTGARKTGPSLGLKRDSACRQQMTLLPRKSVNRYRFGTNKCCSCSYFPVKVGQSNVVQSRSCSAPFFQERPPIPQCQVSFSADDLPEIQAVNRIEAGLSFSSAAHSPLTCYTTASFNQKKIRGYLRSLLVQFVVACLSINKD